MTKIISMYKHGTQGIYQREKVKELEGRNAENQNYVLMYNVKKPSILFESIKKPQNSENGNRLFKKKNILFGLVL